MPIGMRANPNTGGAVLRVDAASMRVLE